MQQGPGVVSNMMEDWYCASFESCLEYLVILIDGRFASCFDTISCRPSITQLVTCRMEPVTGKLP